MAREIKIAEKLTVTFGKARIQPNGDIGTMTIHQSGNEIVLTPEQARALSQTIRAKYGVDG